MAEKNLNAEQVAQLQKENASLKESLKVAEAKHEATETTNQQLKEENTSLKQSVKLAGEKIEESKAAINHLEQKVATLEAAAATCTCKKGKKETPSATFKIGGKVYKWTGPKGFVFDGKRYAAEEAITDEALIQALLELPGQTFLQELV